MAKKREANVQTIIDAIEAGDAAKYDGVIFGACTSTHIYCRVQCPAGAHVSPGNIAAFVSQAAAEAAGYRPCLTCCPEDVPLPSVELGYSEQAAEFAQLVYDNLDEGDFCLRFVCNKMCISRVQVQNLVDEAFDATPEQYVATARRLKAKSLLRQSVTTVEEVAQACGYDDADALREDFETAYKFDADKMALQQPRKPRLSKK